MKVGDLVQICPISNGEESSIGIYIGTVEKWRAKKYYILFQENRRIHYWCRHWKLKEIERFTS